MTTVRVRFEVEFEVTEGDEMALTEDQAFVLCEMLLDGLPQEAVTLLGDDDEPVFALEPCGWAVDGSDMCGDLRIGTCGPRIAGAT